MSVSLSSLIWRLGFVECHEVYGSLYTGIVVDSRKKILRSYFLSLHDCTYPNHHDTIKQVKPENLKRERLSNL